jgi:aspartyl-tRNA(Asn)/glutamyl-tRNA(Gln) amidotransferase subunit C
MYDFPLIFRIPQPHANRTPMALTREQIESIAALARLELTAAELPVYQTSLSSILEFVGALERADTASVTPMAHPLPGLSQRLRPDEVTEQDHHAEYQQNAPQTAAGLYLVPKVIE